MQTTHEHLLCIALFFHFYRSYKNEEINSLDLQKSVKFGPWDLRQLAKSK